MAYTYIHVDVASSGGGNGSSWATSGGNAAYTEAELETYLEDTVAAGTIIYIKGGTYTLDSSYNSSARDGTDVAPIALIGVKSTTTNVGANVVYADWASGADRPFFDLSTYTITVGDYYIIRNLYLQGETNYCVSAGTYFVFENCKLHQDYGSAISRYSLSCTTSGVVINNEFISTNTKGITVATGGRILYNYFHDMISTAQGVAILCTHYNLIAFNIFDNIKNTAVSLIGVDGCTVLNNTFYDCAKDVSATDSKGDVCINNIHEATDTNAYVWTTQEDINFFDHNHGNDARCTDMWNLVETVIPVFKDNNNSSGDPSFTSVGSDFSLAAGSPCLDNGSSIELGV